MLLRYPRSSPCRPRSGRLAPLLKAARLSTGTVVAEPSGPALRAEVAVVDDAERDDSLDPRFIAVEGTRLPIKAVLAIVDASRHGRVRSVEFGAAHRGQASGASRLHRRVDFFDGQDSTLGE